MKNVYLLSFIGTSEPFLPMLWPSAKSYYGLHGKYPDRYNWILPTAEFTNDMDRIKEEISANPPSIFGVSLYEWNVDISYEVCAWVKETWPECIVIVGGPHMFLKYDKQYFKKFHFVDAVAPYEVHGEIIMMDILDNYSDNKVSWNNVEQMHYTTKDRSMVFQSTKSNSKATFEWDYSAYDLQRDNMKEYANAYYSIVGKRRGLLGLKLESTRGCPYACSYCDWGGGVGAKVSKMDVDSYQKNVSILSDIPMSWLHICDANFGIFKDRDTDIMRRLNEEIAKSVNPRFKIISPGFAKTNNRASTIKELVRLGSIDNRTMPFYKWSQQTFSKEALKNIKRTDLDVDMYMDIVNYCTSLNINSQLEMIAGLPGVTYDSYYTEFDRAFEMDLHVAESFWVLLPEAEAYSNEYRTKFKIGTSKSTIMSTVYCPATEVVVETYSYTRREAVEMRNVYAMFQFFSRTDLFNNAIRSFVGHDKATPYNVFLRQFHDVCWPRLATIQPAESTKLVECLTDLMFNGWSQPLGQSIYFKYHGTEIEVSDDQFYAAYFLFNLQECSDIIRDWLLEMGADVDNVQLDYEVALKSRKLVDDPNDRPWTEMCELLNFYLRPKYNSHASVTS